MLPRPPNAFIESRLKSEKSKAYVLDETFLLSLPSLVLKGDAGDDPVRIFGGEIERIAVLPAASAFYPKYHNVYIIAVHGLNGLVGLRPLALEMCVAVRNDTLIRVCKGGRR